MIYLLYLYLFSVRKCLVNSTTFAYSEVFPSLPGYIKPVEIEVRKCEMKISPDTLINKKWHRHQRFLASKCQREIPSCNPTWQMLPLPQWLLRSWGGMQEAVICHLGQLRWTKKGLLQIAEVHMKGMNSRSPEACIFPYTECSIP